MPTKHLYFLGCCKLCCVLATVLAQIRIAHKKFDVGQSQADFHPQGAAFQTVSMLRHRSAANYVQTTMAAAGNRVNLLILDACRNAPTFIRSLFRGEMTLPPGLGFMETTSGSLIAYAASLGGVALDGTGRNSPYVESLMDWIQKPNLSINKVLRGVRNEVVNKTNGKQSPGYSDKLNEDFYFSISR
ncbi:peptidase C14 caspase catalytic subunit p20 [Candidatus Thiomargarita nelsonii]|uniref:Peptidase C14 caspase catalytic subunit p20 n=1 Tax=Candidatus Thiomargarita nelsonii TaxID=1003181 RepID=A0A176S7Z3_9GAMM|nr:peptidase C14 caspase catalytic subunit p20 [Candidatus Thiomargarita nelsonii]